MKATRSALKFTSKNTKKLYRQAYQDCIKDIKAYTGLKEGFLVKDTKLLMLKVIKLVT